MNLKKLFLNLLGKNIFAKTYKNWWKFSEHVKFEFKQKMDYCWKGKEISHERYRNNPKPVINKADSLFYGMWAKKYYTKK